jgi:hypothetical protein
MNLTNTSILKLVEKHLLNQNHQESIQNYHNKGVFSLRNELLFLMYLSVLTFTSGVGILIYKNIDTIGHSIILLILFVLIVTGFYFSFKKSKGFSKKDVDFDNPIYNYVVLLSTILSCTFIGYLQFQYKIFGKNFELAFMVAAFIAFGAAYFFNNKSALSIGITALATSIGITLTPQTLLDNDIYWNKTLSYYGIILGVLIVVWAIYSEKIALKKHFDLVLLMFALHLISICCIAGLMEEEYWFLFVFFAALSGYYFYNKCFEIPSISIYVFLLLYGFILFNMTLFRVFENVNLSDIWMLLIYLLPIYFIGSIIVFIKSIKKFNIKTNDSIQ